MRIFYSFLVVFISINLHSQTFLTNKKPIDEFKYNDISGSAYYFENPINGLVIMKDSPEAFELKLNLNVYEPNLEVYEGELFTEVDLLNVAEVIIPHYDGIDSIHFSKVNRDLLFKLYNGQEYQLFQKPTIKMETITLRPPGQIITKKKFNRYDSFFLRYKDKTKSISINKKEIFSILGDDAYAIAKKTKNKLKTPADLVNLLKAIEEER